MKIKITKQDLSSVIQIVQSVVSTRTTLPILSNILLNCKGDKLRLNATDLDIGISCEIPVETIEEGSITIPAKRFNDIIKELPSDMVTIHSKKNHHIDIEGQKCRFKLNGLPADEFPKFPEFKDKQVLQIDQGVLQEMFRLTSFAVSHEESRYILNGVLMELSENIIRIVATDGRRLAKIEKTLENPVDEDISVIIPIKTVQEINKNLNEEGTVSFVVGKNQVLFDLNGILIASRIIEGEFPNYNQVIPKKTAKKIVLDRGEFLSAIRRANLLTTPDFQAIKFEVFKDKMVISKSTPDIGESREEIAIDYAGPELIIGFNPIFLIDFLKNVEEDTINMELIGVDKPAVMRMNDYLYLALPMRI
jgi:DNA polymerase-3 subunit beta